MAPSGQGILGAFVQAGFQCRRRRFSDFVRAFDHTLWCPGGLPHPPRAALWGGDPGRLVPGPATPGHGGFFLQHQIDHSNLWRFLVVSTASEPTAANCRQLYWSLRA